MSLSVLPKQPCTFALIVLALTGAAILIIGWGLGLASLIHLTPGPSGIAPSTALCITLIPIAILIALDRPVGADVRVRSRVVLAAAALLVSGVALTNLFVQLGGSAQGIDSMLMPELDRPNAPRMSASSAISLLLAAACLATWTLGGRIPRSRREFILALCATTGLAIGLVALVGHVLNTAALQNVSFFKGNALHTTILFLILFVVLVRLAPGGSWFGVLAGDGIGSRGLRRQLPFFLLVPPALGWLVIRASRADYFGPDFHASLLVSGMILLGLAAIIANADSANKLEVERDRSHALQRALADKQLLLSEVNHRVKNNLQQIDVLLAMEAGETDDVRLKRALSAMSGRIRALSLVHQSLLVSTEQGKIALADYLEDLCRGISDSAGLAQLNIVMETAFEPITVPFERAMTLGLLSNELIANSLKHAFEGRDSGRICVYFQSDAMFPTQKTLIVKDDGIGAEAGEPRKWRKGVGTQIVHALVLQLGGTLEINAVDGTEARIRFDRESFGEED